MTLRLRRNDWFILIGAIAGLSAFAALYPVLSPEAAIKPVPGREELVLRGEAFLQTLGVEHPGERPLVELRQDGNQIRYLQRRFGTRAANRLMTDSIPAFYWQIAWRGPKKDTADMEVTIGGEAGENPEPWDAGTYLLRMDMTGRPLSFDYREKPAGTENRPPARHPPAAEPEYWKRAEDLARSLIPDFESGWTLVSRPDTAFMVTSCVYRWEKNTPVAGQKVSFEIEVSENRVRKLRKEYVIPAVFTAEDKRQGVYEGISFVLQYLLIIILGLCFFVARLKSDTLDLKIGLVPALMILACWVVVFWTQVSGQKGWEILIGFVITTPFVAGGVWLMFVLGEAVSREIWADKLTTIDGLRSKFFFPALGRSLLRGLGYGGFLLGLYAVIALALVSFGNAYLSLGETRLAPWSVPFPSLHILARTLLGGLYIAATYCLFFQSWLRGRIRNTVWYVLILLAYWGLISLPLPSVMPFPASAVQNGLVGLAVFLFFARQDFMAVGVALLAMPLYYYAAAALFMGGGFTLHGLLILLIILTLAGIALVSLRSRVPVEQITEYVPEYIRRGYERERIQRELEIARNVQIGFLPRSNPEIPGMEIASFCIPAMEVGGDYFDFVRLGPRRLGIAVGDVSGKGIPAAFYMTLTKGLLKGQAQSLLSPREVLINLNTLFYENAERGVFISMIYAIVDLDARRLVMARAGHNPMLIRRSGSDVTDEICPAGIALGFEQGEVFARTIREEIVDIRPGDVFLFYTDGLNEAQNRFHREYGEERLKRILLDSGDNSAEGILKQVGLEIELFIGDAEQHDDMTAVVVRILEA